MTAVAPGIAPGIYDISEAEYHADPVPGGSLSSTGARKLLAPGCPARYRHQLTVPQEPNRTFEFGTAVHTLVLGKGAEVVVTEHGNWKSKAAAAEQEAIREAGGVPLLAEEGERAHAMAAAVLSDPDAGPLFAPGAGEAELTYIWQDPETGIWCRALLDMSSPLQITDLKTTSDASLEGIQKSVYQYGYHQQDQWYRDAVQAIEGVRPEFRLVFVDKRPPHLVTVVELDEGAQILGAARNARARRIYAECTRTGNWPGHADGITTISLPRWGETHDAMEYL
ncbi:PD-(D/E)XK nuclease-like domain-containing protein [Streptomyces xiamenensis]|uniref:PD-(D/E)XK nuclease-like domain-containing protein n=1 Tax=Streptomyces xiamenensis TaxID=408015 RepID=UPI0035DA8E83